jgi:hypothetical protein
MRIKPQWKLQQIGDGDATAFAVDFAFRGVAPDHLRDFRTMQCGS